MLRVAARKQDIAAGFGVWNWNRRADENAGALRVELREGRRPARVMRGAPIGDERLREDHERIGVRKRDLFEHVLDLLIACAEFSVRGRTAEVRIDRNNMWISDGSNEPRMNSKTSEDENRENERSSQSFVSCDQDERQGQTEPARAWKPESCGS